MKPEEKISIEEIKGLLKQKLEETTTARKATLAILKKNMSEKDYNDMCVIFSSADSMIEIIMRVMGIEHRLAPEICLVLSGLVFGITTGKGLEETREFLILEKEIEKLREGGIVH
jgi:hypothetical protein